MSILEPPNAAFAGTCEVRSFEGIVALVLDVDPAELRKLDLDSPVYVLACFKEPAHANHIRKAFAKALDDAAAANQRKRGKQ